MPRGSDQVALAALETFDALPRKNKPFLRDSGRPEWTVLAAIVLVRPQRPSSPEDGSICRTVSLGYASGSPRGRNCD